MKVSSTPLYQFDQHISILQSRMEICFYVVYTIFRLYHLNVSAEMKTHQTGQSFFPDWAMLDTRWQQQSVNVWELQLLNFWECCWSYIWGDFLSVFQQVLRIGSLTLKHSRSIHHSSICRTPLIPIVVEQTVSVIIWTAEAGLSVFSRSVYTVSIEVYIQYKYMIVFFSPAKCCTKRI